jgi:hypothetical protein
MSPDAPHLGSPDRHRIAILVLGMHRSGTSALTWLLGQMGAALPRDEMLATEENSKGYWESNGLVAADEQLIRAAGSSWFDPRPLDLSRLSSKLLAERLTGIQTAIGQGWGDASLIAIKDPRQCRFVPTVVAQLETLGIAARAVLVLRSATEIAASIARRDATTAPYAQLLWLRHMLDAERDTRALPRTIVSYDGLLKDWRATAARLAPLLGREGWSPDDGGARVEAFLDAGLRHHHPAGAAPPTNEVGALVAAAEQGFAALFQADDAAARTALDDVRARWAAMPWLEGDVVHDELRHRRAPAVAPDAPEPAKMNEPPPPEPAIGADTQPDPEGDAALIRGSGLFDAAWYRATYPEVQESGLDPVDHYLRVGAAKGYNPNPLFDTGYYARQMARRPAGEAL